jgi:hypothetical protein
MLDGKFYDASFINLLDVVQAAALLALSAALRCAGSNAAM